MIIGVDVDNVVYNTTECVLRVHEIDTGEHLEISNIKTYYIEKYVKEQYQKDFHKIFLDKRVWKQVELFKDCQLYISKLLELGHRIIFVTATDSLNFHKKFNFLQRHFPQINMRNNLICIKDKQLLKVGILLDDYSKNLSNITDDYGFNITADYIKFCFDYPWNQDFKCDNINSFRICNWEDFYNKVYLICNEKEVNNNG